MTCYIIRVRRNGVNEYLFNTRVLLRDPALAKTFSSLSLARRYYKKTQFTGYEHDVLPAERVMPFDKLEDVIGK